ncbi:MAG: GNAT family N-acetyltransferase [Ferruginibacter sp.]
MEIMKVGTESIPIIQSIVSITWPATYSEILSGPQITYMLDLIYSTASLQKQIETDGHQFIVAKIEEMPVGFAAYSTKRNDSEATYQLHKIYVSLSLQGKAVGKSLLDYVISDIRKLGATSLELNVNRYNKAVGFYKKQGFVIVEEQDIAIGNGYFMNDYLMRFQL